MPEQEVILRPIQTLRTPDEEISGYYVGFVQGSKSLEHCVISETGEDIPFYGTTYLDRALRHVSPGTWCRIKCIDIKKTKNDHEFIDYKVYFDPDRIFSDSDVSFNLGSSDESPGSESEPSS